MRGRSPEAISEMRWKEDVRAAMELGYHDKVVAMLRKEPDPNKRQHILTNARKGLYKF